MDHLAVGSGGRLHNGLAHGGVRMDGFKNLVSGSLQFSGYYHFRYHLGYVGSNKVSAKPFAVFGVKNYFHEAIRGTRRFGLARCTERKLSDLNLIAGLLRCFLGVPHRRDLR